jgi:3-dehydroquinate synthase
MTDQQTVRVELGDRSYHILIGANLLAQAGAYIRAQNEKARLLIVTDETVAGLHLSNLKFGLHSAQLNFDEIILKPGEATKNWDNLQKVVDAALEARLERGDLILAFGGGVIGDLAGFAAAITRRGMGFAQIPTTLLAQVDSSVGGKTGINASHGKNLIGAFHQPDLVLADTDILTTLSEREFRAGFAEVIKYGLIDDAAFFTWLENNWDAIKTGGPEQAQAIATSCKAKARVVAADERESGQRALLNLGHTFGHALEAATGYDSARLVHGEGVSIGMMLAFRFSHALGLCPEKDVLRVEAYLRQVGLPTRMDQIQGQLPDTDRLLHHIAQDKKVRRGSLTFILAHGIGKSFIAHDISPDKVKNFLDTMRKDASS